jgi:hypothetical protein
VTVHQAIEHASSRWFTDGRRDSGDRSVSLVLDNHTLTLDELLMFGNW